MNNTKKGPSLTPYLSPLGAWALAFGCAVGWGAFVMPGTTFLPVAGPAGTVIGIVIGGLIMLILGVNYHYLMNRYPDEGGTYTYTKVHYGYDHGFLSAWFLILTYTAIIWANATALPLIARNLFGSLFQFGFHYQIASYHVYMGEVLLAIFSLVIAAAFCLRKKLAERVQIVMAIVLIGGITLGICSALLHPQPGVKIFEPPFSAAQSPFIGTFTIIALAPWAYVGFESICHSSAEFGFSRKKGFRIMALAVIMAAFAYAALAVLAVTVLPEGCSNWYEYISNLGNYSGIEGLPTFFSAETIFGSAGVIILGLTTLGGIITGLIGNFIASSRLLYNLAHDRMMPSFLGELDENHTPKNAILFLLGISVLVPFLGRTSTGWIVDVATVGATIAYAYVSAAAIKEARMRNDKKMIAAGMIGFVISVLFVLYFLVPNLLAVDTLSMGSYLILAVWGILGLGYFLYLFKRDSERRMGRSTFPWIVLVLLIIFTASVWMRQSSEATAKNALDVSQSNVVETVSQAEDEVALNDLIRHGHESVLKQISKSMLVNSLILFGVITFALVLLFRIFSVMLKREKQIEAEKVLAEESSRAKTSFLSNMSHEIRTPMNAIIGLDNIALRDQNLTPGTRENLEKIGASAKHLLGLINDILDMSRIESGRMTLKEEEFRFKDFLDQINIIINGQCSDKGLDYDCQLIGTLNDYYIGDDMKLKQVLINILGNSVKFTNVPGTVTLSVEQIAEYEGHCTLRFTAKDTGIGMSKEYIPKIFEAFSQEDQHSANKYGNTGLGMAITKNIVEMMNGEIGVESEKGVGTTFTVTVTLKASARSVTGENGDMVLTGLRALVIDDDEVACEHAMIVANSIGLRTDYTTDPKQALALLRKEKEEGHPYQFALTDYRMPEMDGIDFTKALRAGDGGETAVIIMSGYNWDDMRDEAYAAGADGILSKPLFTDTLLHAVRSILLKREGNGEVHPDAGPAAEPETGSVLEGMHVLIAEDMEINAEILMDLLDMEGISAEHAENGQLAVDMFSKAPEGHFAAILMDVRMPVMDGLEATRAIRALDRPDAKTIPIIAMTANAFDEDVQRSLQAGMTAHLSKPVEPDRLFDTLGKLAKA
ncbi:MAG: amino acid permease [Flexilinea sp.]|nr:amino acid permease [Flexilinea sp.]